MAYFIYVADSVILLRYFNGKLLVGSLNSKILKAHPSSQNCVKFPDVINHIPSIPTPRSRWFTLSVHCKIIKTKLVMLRNLQSIKKRVLQERDLPCSFGSSLTPPLPDQCLSSWPQNQCCTHFFFFESGGFLPSYFRGNTCLIVCKMEWSRKFDLIIFT